MNPLIGSWNANSPVLLSKTQETCLLIALISSSGVEEKKLMTPSRVIYLSFAKENDNKTIRKIYIF